MSVQNRRCKPQALFLLVAGISGDVGRPEGPHFWEPQPLGESVGATCAETLEAAARPKRQLAVPSISHNPEFGHPKFTSGGGAERCLGASKMEPLINGGFRESRLVS